MPGVIHDLPESLQAFRGLAEAVAPALRKLDAAYVKYREQRNAGRIIENSVEAFRVELTYRSNAIEGHTLSLRETQLVIEGYAPTSGKTLREIYEARNHDRALRMIEECVDKCTYLSDLTVQEILDVHAHVLANIDPKSAGCFRTDRVLIKGTRFIPPGNHKFGDLVSKDVGLTNLSGVHPVIQAAALHHNTILRPSIPSPTATVEPPGS